MKSLFTTSFLSLFVLVAFAQDRNASLNFDGVDDHVVIPHHSTLNIGRSAFTIEALIQADTGNRGTLAPMILSKKEDGSASSDGLLFGLTDQGKMALQIEGASYSPGFGGGTGVKAIDLRDGACHHIAWTREVGGVQDTINAYQDGAYVRKTRKAAQQHNIENDHDLWIGWSDFNKVPDIYQFKGKIKEIRIWNYAKTETEIWTNRYIHMTGNETGLIAYWRLNENGGVEINDCGPNGNDGVATNGPTWSMFCAGMDAIPAGCSITPPPVGIDNIYANSDLRVYPNPAINSIRISGTEDQEIDLVRIFEVTGRQVLAKNWNGQDELNISGLNTGIYLLELSNDGEIVFKSRISKN